ncbi:zinc ribbon-containing protein [Marinobacter sp. M216]|uniref:Zinc ribbon-containing protein n=1 Tax=Marinobacter albus TaxID=3030833 RepID=A0ABT7H9Y0_9GAMM|nr:MULTISPECIES: zinc ribbon-containing protein [unclassified Marinobacter]MBW7470561.1 zinc ribbon-containing protein [Marinobacter sp. F4218]MDK9557171.1 zinc ribbon-containing protein [Marinobacter sp. M216]
MTEPERNHLSGKALEVYNRMLERVQAGLKQTQDASLETLEDEIRKAIEFEYELEEMTREEADLLGAYLQRDLEHLLHFVEETGEGLTDWLQLDISLLEHQLADQLLSVADKTLVDTLELRQKLENEDAGHYISGEVATAGMFRCLNCSHMRCLTATSHLEPCDACGSHYYERVTSRWPRKEE